MVEIEKDLAQEGQLLLMVEEEVVQTAHLLVLQDRQAAQGSLPGQVERAKDIHVNLSLFANNKMYNIP